jgi:hypothetical protein
MENLRVTDWISAISAFFTMAATVALTLYARVQISHRSEERQERNARLDATAKVEATLVRRELREIVDLIDSAALHEALADWYRAIQGVATGVGITEQRVARLSELMIERHAKSAGAVDKILSTFYGAADAMNPLAANDGSALPQDEIKDRMAKGRKQLLTCILAVEQEFSLTALPPQYQPTNQLPV